MNPRLAEILAENRRHPYVLSLYDLRSANLSPYTIRVKGMIRGEFVYRLTYRGQTRRNYDFRFQRDEDRLAAAEVFDGMVKMRVWDDRPIRRK